MENQLRGAVFAKYKSISSFANAIGWGRQKAGEIVNGTKVPTVKDVEDMANALDIRDERSFMDIFFPNIVHKADS